MSGRPPCAVHGPGLGDALGRTVTRMLEAALAAADPTAAVARTLPSLALPTAPGTIVVIAIGKAAAAMARPLVAALGRRVRHGVVVSKADVVGPIGPLQILRGDHPIPGAGSIAAGAAILAVLGRCAAGDTVVVALSGGASSLATVPVDGLSLSDLAGGTAALLRSGLDITAINAVRKHVDRLKGGGMACLAAPAKLVTLVLSDVVGDRLDTVASGPTVGDPTTWADAAAAIAAAGPAIPPALRTIVAQGVAGLRPETPDPADPRVATAVHHIVASNRDAVAAAVAAARAEGLLVEEGPPLRGEARSVGAALGRRVAGWPADRPRCVVLGGETTVTVTGTGVGGRNQELALAAALALQGRTQRCVVAFATDGEDGPTTAAGAVVDGQTVARAHARGIDLGEHLRRNDSHPALAASGALLHTGSPGTHATGTNVCDLAFGLLDPRP